MNKILGTILSAACITGLFALCAAFAAIRVLGMQTLIVTGGSMEPNIHKGSLVLVQPVDPSTVTVGDVITFQQYGQTTSHRVIAIAEHAGVPVFHTKGDANTVADPEDKTFAGQVGVVRMALPLVGYAAFGVQAYWRIALTLIAAITFFSCAGGMLFKKQTAAPMHAPRLIRRRVVVTVDADETWNAHREWLRQVNRNTMVA